MLVLGVEVVDTEMHLCTGPRQAEPGHTNHPKAEGDMA